MMTRAHLLWIPAAGVSQAPVAQLDRAHASGA